MKKIAIGADHGGFKLKERIKALLKKESLEYIDVGTGDEGSVDYPDYAEKVASSVSRGEIERGILICGTGIGMSMVANRFPNVRAALCYDGFTARMSREHNDSNILILGGRTTDEKTAEEILKIWLKTEFAGERHKRRLDKLVQIEEKLRKCSGEDKKQ